MTITRYGVFSKDVTEFRIKNAIAVFTYADHASNFAENFFNTVLVVEIFIVCGDRS